MFEICFGKHGNHAFNEVLSGWHITLGATILRLQTDKLVSRLLAKKFVEGSEMNCELCVGLSLVDFTKLLYKVLLAAEISTDDKSNYCLHRFVEKVRVIVSVDVTF